MLKNYHPQHMSGFKWEKGPIGSGQMVPSLPEPPKCKCNLNAKGVVVKKEGPNQGKSFWACPLPQGEQCKFFEWEEKEPDAPTKKRKMSENNTNQEESTRTVALNLLAEKISQLESESKQTKDILVTLYDGILDARSDIKDLAKYVKNLLEKK